MRSVLCGAIFVGLCLPLAASLLAAHTENARAIQPQNKSSPEIILGTTSGRPGATVSVPITFASGQETRVRHLKLTVKFRSAQVKFETLERGSEIDAQELEVRLEDQVTSGEGGAESTTLTIRVAVISDSPEADAVPEGVLGNLRFRIEDDSDGAMINLFTSVTATAAGADRPLPSQRIRVEDGAIFVLAPGLDTLPRVENSTD